MGNLKAGVDEMLGLLHAVFEPAWALCYDCWEEVRLHRRIARILVDNGWLGPSWDKWLKEHNY